jgi:reactive intermediate/imine deaminase
MKQVFGSSHVPLSPAVRAGDFVFVSGQVPVVDGQIVPGGIAAETRAVLENVKKCLEMAGASMTDVVKTTVWLRDRDDFPAFNAAYAEYFPHEPPARSTAESRLMIDIAVEIEAIAYAPR